MFFSDLQWNLFKLNVFVWISQLNLKIFQKLDLNLHSIFYLGFGIHILHCIFLNASRAIMAKCKLESRSWRGVLDTTLCNKVCQWLSTGQWFSPGTLVSSTNKTDCHDIIEILLKMTNVNNIIVAARFSTGNSFSSVNKTNRHDISVINIFECAVNYQWL